MQMPRVNVLQCVTGSSSDSSCALRVSAGIVKFAPTRSADDILNEWSGNIARLLTKVEKATQQISKERMIHKLAAS